MAKVGGLGDVVGALPKYQNQLGAIARVIMPAYRTKFFHEQEWETIHDGTIWLHFIPIQFSILKLKSDHLGFELYLADIHNMLDTPLPYGYDNDIERFIAFQQTVLTWIKESGNLPDLIHCHDHHTGLIPFMMYYAMHFDALKNIPTVFTIHSALYQGWMSWDKSSLLPEYDNKKRGLLEWNNLVNPMAAGIKCAWRYTTVSPGYLNELFTSANGLEQLFSSERGKSTGILNGIDAQVWDPENDPMIEFHFNGKNAPAGKRENKEQLCEAFKLNVEKPLITFIGRLVPEKGADLLGESFRLSMMKHQGNVNFLVLGSGINAYEDELNRLKEQYAGSFNCFIGYHEKLSHQIYASADFLLMPSRVEPCGLNQLYALRYGTIPMVRSTGGLKDTVIDFEDTGGFGIRFDQATIGDVCHAIDRAVLLFANKTKLQSLQEQVMAFDHSWDTSAKHYLDLYGSLK
jgi:starch synthase